MTILAKKKVLEKECNGCSASLSYEPTDVEYFEEPPQGPYEMDSNTVYVVRCPLCQKENRVNYPGPGARDRKAKERIEESF